MVRWSSRRERTPDEKRAMVVRIVAGRESLVWMPLEEDLMV